MWDIFFVFKWKFTCAEMYRLISKVYDLLFWLMSYKYILQSCVKNFKILSGLEGYFDLMI